MRASKCRPLLLPRKGHRALPTGFVLPLVAEAFADESGRSWRRRLSCGVKKERTMKTPYGFGTTLNVPYEEALPRVKEAPKAEGFGVLTEIDVRQTLREKLGA